MDEERRETAAGKIAPVEVYLATAVELTQRCECKGSICGQVLDMTKHRAVSPINKGVASLSRSVPLPAPPALQLQATEAILLLPPL